MSVLLTRLIRGGAPNMALRGSTLFLRFALSFYIVSQLGLASAGVYGLAIGAIGIDFYPPLSDWRDTSDHADTGIATGPSDLGYLRARLTSGEAHDWY